MAGAPEPHVQVAAFDQLGAATLYSLLRLRVDVFVVEQECPYPELDGRDVEPAARHLWIDGPDGVPRAYLRVLRNDDGGAHIGRVVVAEKHRGTGLAGRLMSAALTEVGEAPCELWSQAPVTGFYVRWGFTVTGPEFDVDGIAHVPMRRPARSPGH